MIKLLFKYFFGVSSGLFLLGNVLGISLEFDDAIVAAFPCVEIGHYDAWFSASGNNFDGMVFWSGVIDLNTGVTLELEDAANSTCHLVDCLYEEIVCHKQIQGLYYNKERGERLWPLDDTSLSDLVSVGQGYAGIAFTGGRYTDCEGHNTTANHIYGEVRHTWSGETYHLYAGLDVDFDRNQLTEDLFGFTNNLQFLNSSGDRNYVSGDLRGLLFDTYGGIATFDNMMSCLLPGDNTIIPHASGLDTYFHNDPLSIDPMMQSEYRLCLNGDLDGDKRFRYSFPLDCVLEGDETIVPHDSFITGWHHNDADSPSPRMNNGVRYCFDGYLSGNSSYSYSTPLHCYLEGDGTLVPHDTGITGYQYNHTGFNITLSGERRSCRDGFLSGNDSYKYASYTNEAPKDCRLEGHNVPVPHNSGITGYQYLAVEFGQGDLCTGAWRSCRDGTLSGDTDYQYDSCTVLEPDACTLPWGGQIDHTDTVVTYLEEEVLAGNLCSAQSRTCHHGVLSGNYSYESCTVIPVDRTADYISCSHITNANLDVNITTPSYSITGLSDGYTGTASITTGTLYINNIDVDQAGTVGNGDIISIVLRSDDDYSKTVHTTLSIGDMSTVCSVSTKKEYVDFDDIDDAPELSRNQKYHIRETYNDMLNDYKDDGYNMCSISQSLLVTIGKSLFETNKRLIATSDFDDKRVEYFRKIILEYLVDLTKIYREKTVSTITKHVNGEPIIYEIRGCTNIVEVGPEVAEHRIQKELNGVYYANGNYGFHLKFPVDRQDLHIGSAIPTGNSGYVYMASFGLPLQKVMFTLDVYTQDARKALSSSEKPDYLGENDYFVVGSREASEFNEFVDDEEHDIDDILDSFWIEENHESQD